MVGRMCVGGIAAAMVLHASGATVIAAQPVRVKTAVDWPSFLKSHNITWDELPTIWKQAPFLGNGMMGTVVFQSGNRAVRWQVGRADVRDNRPMDGSAGGAAAMFCRNRLPIGYFELNTVGNITGGSMTLDLYNAEATGVVETDAGTIRWRSFVPTDHMAIVTEIGPSEGERGCEWVWTAEKAESPRNVFRAANKQDWYELPPDPVLSRRGGVNLCTQPLKHGGQTVTAWVEQADAGERRLLVSVAQSHTDDSATDQAVGVVERVQAIGTEQLVGGHRAWWHAFYPQSFVSIPDPFWERFYWVQMYKLASGTRADRALLDLNGPWLQRTPWPGTWWNLNIQLTYWPTYTSNRLGLGASLNRHIYANAENLALNVPEAYRHDSVSIGRATGHDLRADVSLPDGENRPEPGNMLWALHNCWLHYRHSMDDRELRDELYPLLTRAVNYYFHFITEDADGTLHIPKTLSPEYKAGAGPDTNYDLALLRWACGALIASAERLEIDDPLLPKWRNALKNLAPHPVDENGYMIAAGVPFNTRHRHYSHLLMVYPLYLVNADQPGAEAIGMKSMEHWRSFGARHGYAFTGASSIASAFGRGDRALELLDGLKPSLSKTTMYSEIGNYAQCIETPLSAAQSIHDMLLQSWGDTIRVFPAAPDKWADAAFHDLRAEGGFLVSAVRQGGQTKWVRVQSLAGEPCRVKPNLPGGVRVAGARNFTLADVGNGVYTLDLRPGEEALLYSADLAPTAIIQPVQTP